MKVFGRLVCAHKLLKKEKIDKKRTSFTSLVMNKGYLLYKAEYKKLTITRDAIFDDFKLDAESTRKPRTKNNKDEVVAKYESFSLNHV